MNNHTGYAMEGFGEVKPPQVFLFWPTAAALPPQWARTEKFSEGLQPSQTPAEQTTA
jgi:hypothetical protein